MPFNISIYDDNDIYEDDENFTLTINTDSLPDGIIAGSPNKVIVIMRNNDSKCIQYVHISQTMIMLNLTYMS